MMMYQEKVVPNSNSKTATPPQKIRSVNMFHFPARKNNHLWQKHQTELTDDGAAAGTGEVEGRRAAAAEAVQESAVLSPPSLLPPIV